MTTSDAEQVLATYTMTLIGPGMPVGYERNADNEFERYEGIAPSVLNEAEENISDLLLADYYVAISREEEKT